MDELLIAVEEWEKDLIEEVTSSIKDMAELEDESVEALATVFAGSLFLEITDNDWKNAHAMAQILESHLQKSQRGNLS